MTETEVLIDKCRSKIQLARKLEHEAAGLAKQAKSLQKEADAHRAEAERLLIDNDQTELPLADQRQDEPELDAEEETEP